MMEGIVAEGLRLEWPIWLEAVGDTKLAERLAARFQGHRIPKPARVDRSKRNAAIRRRIDQLLREDRERRTNRIYRDVGQEFGGLSERQVRRIADERD